MNIFSLAAYLTIVLTSSLSFFYLKTTCRAKRHKVTGNSFYDSKYIVLSLILFYFITVTQAFLVTDLVSLIIYIFLILPILDNSIVTFMLLKILLINQGKTSDKLIQEHKHYLPKISFIMPSYEEPFDVKKMTLDSILNMDYVGEKEIISVDNSRNTQSEDFIRWKDLISFLQIRTNTDIQFIHNHSAKTLKPGNLDIALQQATGEYVVFVDVDSTLPRESNCLPAALECFDEDAALGFVQFYVVPTNGHFNTFARGVAHYQHMHNATDIVGGMGGFTLFKGHNAIWKKSVLDEIGTWLEYLHDEVILVEDFLKTFQTYRLGYYGRVLWIETGEWIPSSLKSFTSMWNRWVYGTLQVVVKNIKFFWYSNEFTVFEKFELFRRIKFGLYFLPYLTIVICLLFPYSIFIPYLISVSFMHLFGIYVSSIKNNFEPHSLDSNSNKYYSYYVELMVLMFVNWIGFTASVKFFWQLFSWFLRRFDRSSVHSKRSQELQETTNFWNVTKKGFEVKLTIINQFKKNSLLYICHITLVLLCLWFLVVESSSISEVFIRLYAFFYFLNILLLPTLLGSIGRTQENNTSGATIDYIYGLPDVEVSVKLPTEEILSIEVEQTHNLFHIQ